MLLRAGPEREGEERERGGRGEREGTREGGERDPEKERERETQKYRESK